MVAPTRTPQARGVKCDLCKKILSSATWLDQTKLAKEIEEAQGVLSMIKQHNTTDCPCIPRNIENLLVGSTHFEIHRLVAKKLDSSVDTKQYESFIRTAKTQSEKLRNPNEAILNDCQDCSHRGSRFKIYDGFDCPTHVTSSKQQLEHLRRAIDYWRLAMEDQTHPFNAKLALRLGLTHHVIYACYLFKYFKILDYQLITANLLLNVFRSIDGVTANAILHAYYLLIRSLVDCDQLQLARHHLRQAMKLPNYNDRSNYESILVNCIACELSFMDGRREGAHNILDDLSDLIYIKADDKLQHYYARTLAMSMIVRYIHHYPSKTDHCFEFFHTFRYICAMIRRCYESSFELVMAEKDLSKKPQGKDRLSSTGARLNQILDHSWIRFAICDFVYNSFDLLAEFYLRAGMPECLELIYNGLNLISYRNGCVYWQSKILLIGARLDLLCDKYDDAKKKFDHLSRIVSHTDDSDLMNVIRLASEVGFLEMISQQGSIVSNDVTEDILNRIKTCKISMMAKVQRIELYDAKSNSFSKTCENSELLESTIILNGPLGKMSLMTLGIFMASSQNLDDRIGFVSMLKRQLELSKDRVLEFYDCQMIIEALVCFTNIENSEKSLLDAVLASNLFIEIDDDRLLDIQSQMSSLTLQGGDAIRNGNRSETLKQKTATSNKKGSKIPTSRRSKRKGTYEVAILTEKNLNQKSMVRMFSVLETVTNFETLTNEEIIVSYLRNSEPNPHYSLYRRAHELMLTYRLAEDQHNLDSILFHISESATANTMRYRWMMSEEQCMSPFDHQTQQRTSSAADNLTGSSSLKHLGFCNTLVNQDNVIRSMTRTIPDDTRLIQLKYILDKRADLEHLLCVCIGNNNNEQTYIHARKSLASDDFFSDATILLQNANDTNLLTIENRLATKIDESRKSLMMKSNQRMSRSEVRQKIESDISVILHDIENDWLGAFRFLFCGKICDPSYGNMIQCLMSDLQSYMSDSNQRACRSLSALRMVLENAPLLSREEFCQVMGALFNCDSGAKEPRECFNKWLKCIETHMAEHNLGMNKTVFLKQLQRGQVGLILDNKLEMIPFESLPVVRVSGQGIFRIPSLRLFSIMSMRRCSPIKIDPSEVAYMLDPAHNLAKTRERFDNKLKSQTDWCGTIGHPPKTEELESWLSSKQLYIFIGHGAGTAYYNKLCKGRGLSALAHIECSSIVMGCSSGRMLAEGPQLETFGIGWMFLFKGGPCYVGLLWDVTDCDIDKFLDALLDKWLPARRRWSSSAPDHQQQPITNVLNQARNVCQLKLLVGSTPVVYGLPIWCID